MKFGFKYLPKNLKIYVVYRSFSSLELSKKENSKYQINGKQITKGEKLTYARSMKLFLYFGHFK